MAWQGIFKSAWIGLAAVGLGSVLCAGAGAAPITRSFEFEVVGLENQIFDPADFPPTDPVTGWVTLTFDPMGPAVVDESAGILAFAINIALASPVGFNYDPALDILTLGGLGAGVEGGDVADFLLRIADAASSAPSFLEFWYTSRPEFYIATSGSVSLTAVAEPGTLAIFALGLATVFLALLVVGVTPSPPSVRGGMR